MNANRQNSVAFAFPPGVDIHAFQSHLGVAYIRAYLSRHGIKSTQLTSRGRSTTLQHHADRLVETGAPIIGLTCFDVNFYVIRALARLVKQQKPDCTLLVGGPSATFSDELILSHCPEIDVAVRFEGEETARELVEHIQGGGRLDDLDRILGITFRRDNSLIRNPDRPLFCCTDRSKLEGLDGLPSPYLTGILNGTEAVGLVTARGCPHKCTYCNFSAMGQQTIRYHSVDRIIEELGVIAESQKSRRNGTPPASIQIHDDAFTLNAKRAKQICRRIIDEGISVRISGLCRADNMDEELVSLMEQAGFQELAFGLESSVPRILRNIKKVCSLPVESTNGQFLPEERFLEKIKETVSLARKYKMKAIVSIILGLPGETEEEGRQTIEFVKQLNVDSYAHNFLSVLRGTEIFDTMSDYGIQAVPSETGLPLHTSLTYDVKELPILRHSLINEFQQATEESALMAFAGGSGSGSEQGDGVEYVIWKMDSTTDLEPAIQWLSKSLAVNGLVVVLDQPNDGPVDRQALLDGFARERVPTFKPLFLHSQKHNGTEVYKFDKDQMFAWDVQLPVVSLTESAELDTKTSGPRNRPIMSIQDERDVNVIDELGKTSRQQVESGEGSMGLLDGVFRDGCRWGRSVCPAIELKRVVIDQQGQIQPCLTGGALGRCDQCVSDLKERAAARYTQVREERNCDACPADSRCAKCLFPHPFSVEEYCNIQRNRPDLASVVIATNVGNTLATLTDRL